METDSAARTEADVVAFHSMAAWGLIMAGVLLLLLSGPLAGVLVPKQEYAPHAFQWSPELESRIAISIQILAGMTFLAGLAERIVWAIMDTAATLRHTAKPNE